MSSSKKTVVRSAKSTSQPVSIKLSQIRQDTDRNYCHRMGDWNKPDSLAPLADSLVSEGQNIPITVVDSGEKDAVGLIVYILIGGFCRFFAWLLAIKQSLDKDRIHPDMLIDAMEVIRGGGQSESECRNDLLIRSIAENEQRHNYSTIEKLEIVRQCKEDKIPDTRVASALAISETQHRRFVSIVEHPWLQKYVVDIGSEDAGEDADDQDTDQDVDGATADEDADQDVGDEE